MASVAKREWTGPKGEKLTAWVVRYSDRGGKRRLKTFDKKKDADRFRTEVEGELRDGVHVAESETLTFREAAEHYIGDCERRHRIGDRMSGQSLDLYRRTIRRYLLPRFGAMKLTAFTSLDMQNLIDESSTRFSKSTVSRMHELTWQVLDFAIKKRWLRRNILQDDKVRLPRGRQQRVFIPTKEELQQLIEAARRHHDNASFLTSVNRMAIVCLGAFCGLRVGEMFGLQWENVDFDRGIIRVRHSQGTYDGLKEPKTAAGVRDVPLTRPVEVALMEVLRYWQTVEVVDEERASVPRDTSKSRMRRLWLGRRIEPDQTKVPTGYVLQTAQRQPLKPSATVAIWHPLMKAADLMDGDGVRFTIHALRHAAASLFIEAGLPPMNLKQVMGHSSVTMTYDVYGHLFPDDDRVAVAARGIAGRLFRDTGATSPRNLLQINA